MVRKYILLVGMTLALLSSGGVADIDRGEPVRLEPVDDPLMLPYRFTINLKKIGLGEDKQSILEQFVPADIFGHGTTGLYGIGHNWRPADSLTGIIFYADIEQKKTISHVNVKTNRITSHRHGDYDGDGVIEVAVTYTRQDTLWLELIDPVQKSLCRMVLIVGRDLDGNGFWDGAGVIATAYDFNGDGYPEFLINCDTGYDLYPRKLICVDWFNDEIRWEFDVAGIVNSGFVFVQGLVDGEKPSIVFATGSKGNAAVTADMDDRHAYLIVLDDEGRLRWKKEMGGVFSSCCPVMIDRNGDGISEILATCRYETPGAKAGDETKYGGMLQVIDRHGALVDSVVFGADRVVSWLQQFDWDTDGEMELFISLTDASLLVYDKMLRLVRQVELYSVGVVWDCRDFLGQGRKQLLMVTRDNKLWLLDTEFEPLAQFSSGEVFDRGKSAVFSHGDTRAGYGIVLAGDGGHVNYFLALVDSPWSTVFFRHPGLAFLAALVPMGLVVILVCISWYRTRAKNRVISEQRDRLDSALERLRAAQEQLVAVEQYRRTEQQLRASQQRYSELVNLLPQGVYEVDLDGKLTFANRQAFAVTGYTQDDVDQGLNTEIMFPVHEQDRARQNMAKVLRGEQFDDHEYTFRRKDGSTFPVLIFSSPIMRGDQPVGLRGILLDITERKRAMEALKESETRYHELFESIIEGIGVVDENEIIQFCNPAYAHILGVESAEHLIGKNILDFVPEDQKSIILAQTEKRKKNQASQYELDIITAQQERKTILVSASPRFNDSKQYIGAFGAVIDITERQRVADREKARLQLFNDLRSALSVDACLECGCRAIYEAGLFKRAVITLHNEHRQIVNLGQVGLDPEVITAARQAPAPDDELTRNMTQDKFRIGHAYFVPEEAALSLEDTPRYVAQEAAAAEGDTAWKTGDELFVPLRGEDDRYEGWLSVDTPFYGRRPTSEVVRFLEQVVDIVRQKVREIVSMEQLRQSLAALRKSEERARTLLDGITETMILIDNDGTILTMNQSAANRFGRNIDQMVGLRVQDLASQLVSPEVAKDRLSRIDEAIGQNKPVRFEDERDGRLYDTNYCPAVDADGEVVQLAIFAVDVTERKRAEEALRESERILLEAQRIASTGSWQVDVRQGVEILSPTMTEIYGINKSTISLEEGMQLVHPDDRPGAREAYRQVAAGKPVPLEYRIVKPDGEVRTVFTPGAHLVRDDKGEVVKVVGVTLDITERKQAEEALKNERDFVHSLMDTANSLIVCLDGQARITVFNRECEKVTGYEREEVLGKSWPGIFLPRDHHHHSIEDFAAWVRQHPEDMYEGPLITKSGQVRTILWSNSALFSDDSDEVTALAVGQDITDRKEAERQLELANRERYNQVRQIAGGVAHEIHNALYPATSSVAKLKERLTLVGSDDLTRHQALITLIEKSVTRALSMTELVTRYSRLESEKRQESVDLTQLLQTVVSDNRSRIEQLGVTVNLNLQSDITCRGWHIHIYSLFNNIMVNALDALEEVSRREVSVMAAREGEKIRVEFTDSGPGIPPENKGRIFSAFFSTRPKDGTGLGLAMAKKIAELYNGSIEVESELDKGTKFVILL
ncbi:MAG: PAS domain S-box protein [bacterium]